MALDKFPVDESALPRVTISAKRLDEWKEVSRDEINRALSNRHSWYNAFKDKIRDGYDMIADKPNLKAFVRSVPNSSDKDILIRSTFDDVTLDDIASGVYSESSYELRCAFAHMYEENFLDAGILHTHETRTEEDPLHFVGVRWIAFRSPTPKLVTSRDFVYFSYEGTMLDVKGERVLFRFLRTMPMDDVPIDSSQLPPLVRGKISNLHLYRQNGTHVEAYVKAMHSNAGSMPSYVVTKTIAFMYSGVTNMETIGDARALMRQGLTRLNTARGLAHSGSSSFSSSSSSGALSLSQSGGPPPPSTLASANACGVCFHKFKLTRSKRQCHGCSRTVCKRCTRAMHFFDEQKQMSSTGVARLRFCLNCTRHARSESSCARSPSEPSTATNHSQHARALHLDGSRNGSSGSSGSMHRVSSQDSLARTPSHDGSYHSHGYPRTPSQDSASRTPSHDGSHHNSLYRIPSHGSMHGLPRPPSHDNLVRQPSQASSHHTSMSQSTVSFNKSQPEADFSDEEIFEDELDDNRRFVEQPTHSPPEKPLAASKIMSFKSSSSQAFQSSQVSSSGLGSSRVVSDSVPSSHAGPVSTRTFDSSQVVIAFEGSPVASKSAFESSHVGQYAGFRIKHAAGDSEEEEDDDEDFGDFHDSDSDDIGDIDGDYDYSDLGTAANHPTLAGAAGHQLIHHDHSEHAVFEADDYSDNYSIIDTDDYSIAGSFSYDFGPPSFMALNDNGEFNLDDEIGGHNSMDSRGSFVPLTFDGDKPSVVAQQFSASGGPRPLAAAPPVPQLSQHRVPPRPLTLRNCPPPGALPPMLDETAELDGSFVPPPPLPLPIQPVVPHTKRASRIGLAPNLLSYGATKRTNRPSGAGMAPVRRAVSGTGGGVIVNGVNHAVAPPAASGSDVDDVATGLNVRVNLHHDAADTQTPTGTFSPGRSGVGASMGGNVSPLIRYYGS